MRACVVPLPEPPVGLVCITHMDTFPGAGLGVPGEIGAALTLFVAVHERNVALCQQRKRLPCRYTGNNTYIGFRESEKEAVDRASKVFFGSGVGKDTYVLLVIGLTPEALAHFTAEAAGEDYQFASMLHKVTYPGRTDWKVWHFCGDFPLGTPGVVWQFCGEFPLGASCVCAASHAPPVGLGCVTPTGAFPGVGLGGCSAPPCGPGPVRRRSRG